MNDYFGVFIFKYQVSYTFNIIDSERERGQMAVYNTSPQSFIIEFLICWLNNFGEFSELVIVLIIEFSVQTFNQ